MDSSPLGFRHLGIRAKLISLFVVVKVLPLILIIVFVVVQLNKLRNEITESTQELTSRANIALNQSSEVSLDSTVDALEALARENIERMTTDMAYRTALFLKQRDSNIAYAATLTPIHEEYQTYIDFQRSSMILPAQWVLSEDQQEWVLEDVFVVPEAVKSTNKENDLKFSSRPPSHLEREMKPLFLEMTYIDLQGMEIVKATTSDLMSPDLKDVSKKENTFVRSETYFDELKDLKEGEIYVSNVIGAYVPSKLIGKYTPDRAVAAGLEFMPEQEAYAGLENPNGKRFEGLIRWATPVIRNGGKIGYVTLALDYNHILEILAFATPTDERYTLIPDAGEGNYVLMIDNKGRNIAHPRHHSIVGYDPETGEQQVPWLEQSIYDRWQESGKPYAEFIIDEPVFQDQSIQKNAAIELTEQGFVGVDCRYQNNAPQCTGWFDLASTGGSGSFTLLWSGLTKLSTAAAIPYYTGQYGDTSRGFGVIAVTAVLNEFHLPANQTASIIENITKNTNIAIKEITLDSESYLYSFLRTTITTLVILGIVLAFLISFIATLIASYLTRRITYINDGVARFLKGEWQFRFNEKVTDELGTLYELFNKMADNTVSGVQGAFYITDLGGKVLYANEYALDLINRRLEDIIGVSYLDIFLFRKEDPLQYLAEGKICEPAYHEATASYFQSSAYKYYDPDKNHIGYAINSFDITDKIAEQQQAELYFNLLKTIFKVTPDLIWYKNKKGHYVSVNSRFEEYCGMPESEILGKSLEKVCFSESIKKSINLERECIETRSPLYSEEEVVFADGHVEILEVVRTPRFDKNGSYVGLVGIGHDVSERVGMNRNLRENQAVLEKAVREANLANVSKSNFLSRMSHEIRTPMSAIIGMGELALRKLEEEVDEVEEAKNGNLNKQVVHKYIKQIEISAQHLLGLVNEILEISKIEAGKVTAAEEVFNLPELLQTVEDLMSPRCAEKQLKFSTDISGLEEVSLLGDPLHLRQVLINLLGNAIKFTEEEGNITLLARQEQSIDGKVLIHFEIKDDGIGMDSVTMAKLFKPFEQGSYEISKNYGGSGLGLSISQGIVKLLGGTIKAESTEGLGSCFTFALWFKEGTEEEHVGQDIDTTCLKGKRILIVDDVEINRFIVKELLDGQGLTIEEAADGTDAVEMIEKSDLNYYDLVLMDVQMPIMNGYRATHRIRNMGREDTAQLPIIALTANSFAEDVQKALDNGMDGHLGKPIEYDLLLKVLVQYFC